MIEIPESIQTDLDKLTDDIRESDIFQRYERCRKEIVSSPELYEAMNRFRRENLELTLRLEGGNEMDQEIRDKMKDRQALYTNPVIREYLDAELALCLLLRKLVLQIGTLADLKLDELSDLL